MSTTSTTDVEMLADIEAKSQTSGTLLNTISCKLELAMQEDPIRFIEFIRWYTDDDADEKDFKNNPRQRCWLLTNQIADTITTDADCPTLYIPSYILVVLNTKKWQEIADEVRKYC